MVQLTSPRQRRLRDLVYVASAIIIVGVLGSSTDALAQPVNAIPAFPGAEGHGALALSTCDRSDIKVIEVTNLDSSGPGSLRDAIENQLRDGKLDIVRFRTGCTIDGGYSIKNSCVYIAGQTAPGDGIQLRGGAALNLVANRHNIVVRYLRLRSNKGTPGGNDVMSLGGGHDIILDHLSLQWGNDEVLTFNPVRGGAEIYNITIQRSIIAEGLRPHSTGMLFGDNSDAPDKPLTHDASIHHNIYAHNAHRNPRSSATNLQIANNIVYNWRNKIGGSDADVEIDYVSNVYTPGPWAPRPPANDWLRHAACPSPSGPLYPIPDLYISGNIFGSDDTPDVDQWTRIRHARSCGATYTRGSEIPTEWERFTPLADAPVPVTLQSADDARTSVLSDVGANRRLDCDGSWVWVQDRVDSDIIQNIQQGTGPATDEEADNPDDYGGFPTLAIGTPCPDTDNDGMPDDWEQKYFASITAAVANDDTDSDGYTNVEEYLNGSNPIPGIYPTLPGIGSPAQDLDGDGKAEDLNANSRLDFADVLALYHHLDSQAVHANQNYFDFTGDGQVDMADVRELFKAVR